MDMEILVVGGGDAALDYALTLAGRNRVTVAFRGAVPRAIPPLRLEAGRHPAITFKAASPVVGFGAEKGRLKTTFGGAAPATITVDYVFVAAGRDPEDGVFRNLAAGDTAGRILPVGDVVNGRRRQVAVAAGEGARAALAVAEKVVSER
jgi:thioredoxin reductase